MKHHPEYYARLKMPRWEQALRHKGHSETGIKAHKEEARRLRSDFVNAFYEWQIEIADPNANETKADEKLALAARNYFEHQYIWIS